MHIPDGFLDAKTLLTTGALAATGVSLALRTARRELPPRRVPLLGLSAAFLFAAQMVNFPVVGGTSGHLIGGALAAALLGPAAAVIVVTAVLIVQCLLFADGGVLALGANVLNMAVVAPLAGYAIYRGLSRLLPGQRGRVAALIVAGWASTVFASLACAGQLAWSGTVAWGLGLPAMAGIHALIGLGEGLISGLVLLAVERTRADWTEAASAPADAAPLAAARPRAFGLGLLASFGVAFFVAPFACPWPDGLEAVAERLGFHHRALDPLLPAPLPDYVMPGNLAPGLATALAGLAGTAAVLLFAWLASRALVGQRPPRPTA